MRWRAVKRRPTPYSTDVSVAAAARSLGASVAGASTLVAEGHLRRSRQRNQQMPPSDQTMIAETLSPGVQRSQPERNAHTTRTVRSVAFGSISTPAFVALLPCTSKREAANWIHPTDRTELPWANAFALDEHLRHALAREQSLEVVSRRTGPWLAPDLVPEGV